MPAFESRRVRTQPFTVTGASCGALPAKIQRTLNTLSSIERELSWSSVKSQSNGGNPDQATLAVRTGATMARLSSSIAGKKPLGPPTLTPPSILKLQCADAGWWLRQLRNYG